MEAIVLREQVLQEVKAAVAEVSLKVIPSPEEHVHKLRTLIVQLNQGDTDERVRCAYFSVQKLLAYSVTEIFKTILPDYEVAEDSTESDAGPAKKRMKKDDFKLIQFEHRLLNIYKQFVDQLERMAQLVTRKAKEFRSELMACVKLRSALSVVAIECICQLISYKPSFNYTERLITISIRAMILSKSNEMQQAGCEAFETLFRQDSEGDISWIIVRELTKLIKSAGITTEPRILQTFLSLNIREIDTDDTKEKTENITQIRQKLHKMSRKQRKHNKELQKLKKDLVKNDIEQNTRKVNSVHTQILSQIFSIYFRVLKVAVAEIDHPEKFQNYVKILDPVLAGLAQFAHLININFFEDVFNLMHKLLLSNGLTSKQNFHCLITIFTILSGQGEVLTVDPQRFYAQFYRELLNVSSQADQKDVEMILRCVHVMLIRRRKNMTTNRLLGFLKRFATLSLNNDSPASMALLSVIRYIVSNFAKADILLDNENSGCGVFLAESEDPEFSNASSTQLYEMHLARKFYDPNVARFADHILSLGKENVNQIVTSIPFEELKKSPNDMFESVSERMKEIQLPDREKVSNKRRFHGYVLDTESLAQISIQKYDVEQFL
jgi:nucleolar complex protein 3